jgi:hypothetical protein
MKSPLNPHHSHKLMKTKMCVFAPDPAVHVDGTADPTVVRCILGALAVEEGTPHDGFGEIHRVAGLMLC